MLNMRACVLFAAALLLSAFAAGCAGGVEEEAQAYPEAEVCFVTEAGLLAPVRVPVEGEDAHMEALKKLVDSDENRLFAAAKGLCTVIPEGCLPALDVKDGRALVMFGNVPVKEGAEAEKAMVDAIVETLTSFVDVDSVSIHVYGGELPHGTDISEAFVSKSLNVEPGAASTIATGGSVTELALYFPNYESTLSVPVTRLVGYEPTLEDAIRELLAGPVGFDSLRACFPVDTELVSVTVEKGVAHIELSRIAENVLEQPQLSVRAKECVGMVCSDFGVPECVVSVLGAPLFDE